MADDWQRTWTEWGYCLDGRRLRIDPDRHLMRIFGNTPLVNRSVFEWWKRHDVKVMKFALTHPLPDDCLGFVASVGTFDLFKKVWDNAIDGGQGLEAQYHCQIAWHRIYSHEQAVEKVRELMETAPQ